MEDDVQYYKLKNIKLTDEHKRKISEGMKMMYASRGGKRTIEERNAISEGMRRYWDSQKILLRKNCNPPYDYTPTH